MLQNRIIQPLQNLMQLSLRANSRQVHKPSKTKEHLALNQPQVILPARQPQSSPLVVHSHWQVSQSLRSQCQYAFAYRGGNRSMASLYFL